MRVLATPSVKYLLRNAAVALGTLVLNGAVVALLWAEGVGLAIIDNPQPGESGFLINPLTTPYKVLLGCLVIANIGTLLYLVMRQQRWYAVSFAAGAAGPVSYAVHLMLFKN